MDADTRSNIALLASLGSLLVSAVGFLVNTFRDRPRLKVTSKLWHDDYGDAYKIAVNVVNKGRRPVILRIIGGHNRKGEWGGTYLDSEKGGVRLGEHEHKQFQLDKEEVVLMVEDGPDEPYDAMWIEDTLGNRHKIPNSGEYIARMYPSTRTGG